jgi:hypothetical protein
VEKQYNRLNYLPPAFYQLKVNARTRIEASCGKPFTQ